MDRVGVAGETEMEERVFVVLWLGLLALVVRWLAPHPAATSTRDGDRNATSQELGLVERRVRMEPPGIECGNTAPHTHPLANFWLVAMNYAGCTDEAVWMDRKLDARDHWLLSARLIESD